MRRTFINLVRHVDSCNNGLDVTKLFDDASSTIKVRTVLVGFTAEHFLQRFYLTSINDVGLFVD